MQPLVTEVRSHLSAQQVEDLIRVRESVTFSAGCELLEGLNLVTAEDVTAGLVDGSVTRGSYNRLHASGQMTFDRLLPWARAIIRPYIVLSDGIDSARFNLGAYYTSSPVEDPDEEPPRYAVTCHDVLQVLDDPVGDAYSVGEGTRYLAAVEQILLSRGIVRYLIDQTSAGAVLTSDMVWQPSEQLTWLTIVNDLLSAVGYAGIWSDWDGVMRCQSYVSPRDRAPEWRYDTDPQTGLIKERKKVRDFFKTPNVWIFTKSNDTDGPQPVEGNGRYTYINQSIGDTSIDARGRTITRPVQVQAADQAALVATATRMIDADMSIPAKVDVTTFPVPLSWHFDVIDVDDPGVGPPAKAVVTSWSLPLGGDDMRQEWTLLLPQGAE